MRFLVVDDSGTMRRIIAKALKDIGADTVVEAGDGMEALLKLQSAGKIDVILTDWNMPKMNGLEFLKSVKGNAAFKDIPVIMVTTEAEKASVLEAIKAGARNYVAKPFTPDVLKAKVEQTLGIAK
ncbi:MAG TPA: response regulator [Planctomycetota bacterium]|nr:response regulator [Planctomycetota bacterium]